MTYTEFKKEHDKLVTDIIFTESKQSDTHARGSFRISGAGSRKNVAVYGASLSQRERGKLSNPHCGQ